MSAYGVKQRMPCQSSIDVADWHQRVHRIMARKSRSGSTSAGESTVQLVQRRCLVCEWEALQIESAGTDPSCPWCHAPTQGTVVLPRVPGVTWVPGKNLFAAALGRLGGLKGGRARAKRL